MDVDFIRNVFESLGLREVFPGALEAQYAPGLAAHIKTHYEGVSLVAEWNAAMSYTQFTQEQVDYDIRPSAWQLQLAYQFDYYAEMEELGAEGSYIAVQLLRERTTRGFLP